MADTPFASYAVQAARKNPFGKPRPGETPSEAATRRAAFYHHQAEYAHNTGAEGDPLQAATDAKIHAKLGAPAPMYNDPSAGDKAALSMTAMLGPDAALIVGGLLKLGMKGAADAVLKRIVEEHPSAPPAAETADPLAGWPGLMRLARNRQAAAEAETRAGQATIPRVKGATPKGWGRVRTAPGDDEGGGDF